MFGVELYVDDEPRRFLRHLLIRLVERDITIQVNVGVFDRLDRRDIVVLEKVIIHA